MEVGLQRQAKYDELQEKFGHQAERDLVLHIVLNQDYLPVGRISIHAAHALAEYLHLYMDRPVTKRWLTNQTIVLLGASPSELQSLLNVWTYAERVCATHAEASMGGLVTAIAFEPIAPEDGEKFFSLLPSLEG